MKDPVLVLGGGGFLGSRVALRWAREAIPVRLLDCTYLPNMPLPECAEIMTGNVFDRRAVARALRGVGTVHYFVGHSVPALSRDNVTVEVQMTLNALTIVLELMADQGVPRLLFPSSGGTVYGCAREEKPFKEDDPLHPDGAYGMGKKMCEDVIRFFGRKYGLEYVIGRISNPYGHADAARRKQGIVDAALARVARGLSPELWGDGTQVRDFIHVEDVVDALWLIERRRPSQITVNIGSGQGVAVNSVLQIISKVTGCRPPPKRTPDAYVGVPYNVLDVSRLRALVSWQPTYDIESGIRKAWEEIRKCSTG